MRFGQIGCGRQNPPVQSAELPSRIGMAKGMPSTSLQDWKAATRSIASLAGKKHQLQTCVPCPENSVFQNGACQCSNELLLNYLENECVSCPELSYYDFGTCQCSDVNMVFDHVMNQCVCQFGSRCYKKQGQGNWVVPVVATLIVVVVAAVITAIVVAKGKKTVIVKESLKQDLETYV
ncbi:Hypothetical_protein [Hexamita inflata]|uniref:Hypothetical_protein n=1 Tax=Hexamita inflata TaxID=28002 RepID=A0AA86UCA3_9EUKA|nr:Hypothetical protein HINF_LOCUS39960 [Hexamita inflata]